jgi:hypothetical protein
VDGMVGVCSCVSRCVVLCACVQALSAQQQRRRRRQWSLGTGVVCWSMQPWTLLCCCKVVVHSVRPQARVLSLGARWRMPLVGRHCTGRGCLCQAAQAGEWIDTRVLHPTRVFVRPVLVWDAQF